MDYALITRAQSHAKELSELANELSVGPGVTSGSAAIRQQQRGTILGAHGTRIPKLVSTSSLSPILEQVDDRKDEESSRTTESKDDSMITTMATNKWITFTTPERERHKELAHYDDLWGCLTRNFGKGFALGVGGRVFLNALYEMVSLARHRSLRGRNIAQALVDGAREHGVAFGILLAVHNSVMFATRDAPPQSRFAYYRGAGAGFISGLASLWSLPPAMRRSVVLFSVVRAFEVGCRVLAKKKLVPTMSQGDTFLMSFASAIMIWTFVYFPKCLDPAYAAFLARHSQFPMVVVAAVGAMQSGLPIQDLDKVNAARVAAALPGPPPPPISGPLAYDAKLAEGERVALLLHPTRSFFRFALLFFVRGLFLAGPVYGPVYLLPLIVFRRRKLLKEPIKTISEAVQGVARSSIFLSLYCTMGIAGLALGRRIGFRHDVVGPLAAGAMPAVSGFLGGLSTLIEKKPRRIELALYVFSKAIEGVHNLAKEKLGRNVASPPGGPSLAFAIALAVVTHANLRHPDVVRSVYSTTLMRFFDTEARHKMF